MEYHLFKRTEDKKTVWYYWYWKDGKRVRKSTKQTVKWKAEQIVDALRTSPQGPTITQYIEPFFTNKCPYLRHKKLKPSTIEKHIDNKNRILQQFGPLYVSELIPRQVEDWLHSLSLSNSTKNEIMGTLSIIMTEAARDRVIPGVPIFRKLPRDSQRYDALTESELEILFPEDPQELAAVWKIQYDTYRTALMIGTLFAVSVSAGLRPGEARALRIENLYLDRKGITITGQIDKEMNLTNPKKSTLKNLKHRAVLLPDRTIKMLNHWIDYDNPEYFIFHSHGPLRAEFVQGRFKKTITRLGLGAGRKLSPHSLRYTYNTKMENHLSGSMLRQIMGHSTAEMTAHYSNAGLDQRLQDMQLIPVNQFWGQSQ